VQVLSLISPFQVIEAAAANPARLASKLRVDKILKTGFMV